MFSKSLSTTHSIGLSVLSSILSLGYVFHDRYMNHVVNKHLTSRSISSNEEQDMAHEMVMNWWPPQ